jgi:hypothetical protein
MIQMFISEPMSNAKAQSSNKIQWTNHKLFDIGSFGIDLTFGF